MPETPVTPKRPCGSPVVRNPPLSRAEREDRLAAAIRAYNESKGSKPAVKQLARDHDVAYSTLRDRLGGRRSWGDYSADRQKLSKGSERAIMQWCCKQAELFVPVTPALIRERAIHVLRVIEDDHEANLDVHWPQAFLKRHPELKSLMSRQQTAAKLKASTPAMVNEWFDHLSEYLAEVGITTDRIFNMDETGFKLGEVRRRKVYTDKQINPRGQSIGGESQGHVTVIECVSKDRHNTVPPYFIFKGKAGSRSALDYQVPVNAQQGLMAKAQYGFTESAFVNEQHCITWLIDCFDRYTREDLVGSSEPPWRCIIMDNLAAHITYAMLEAAERRHIMIVALPPNTTHLLQPLDVGVFSHLKEEWHKLVQSRLVDCSSKMGHAAFVEAYGKARQAAITPRVCRMAFQRCGITHELNRATVLASLPSSSTPSPPPDIDPAILGTPSSAKDLRAYLHHTIGTNDRFDTRQKHIQTRQIVKYLDILRSEGVQARETLRRYIETAEAEAEQKRTSKRRLHVLEGPVSVENLQAVRQSQLSSHNQINLRRSGRSRKARGGGTAGGIENQPLSMDLGGRPDYSARSPSFDSFKSLSDSEDHGFGFPTVYSAI
ncbi:unnamed protein product [Parajaminaea phylloscopi]